MIINIGVGEYPVPALDVVRTVLGLPTGNEVLPTLFLCNSDAVDTVDDGGACDDRFVEILGA